MKTSALYIAAVMTLTAAMARAETAPGLLLQQQHSFTGEVRAIAVEQDRVWAATGGGLAVFDRDSGAHLATLTSAQGLPGNSLNTVVPLDSGSQDRRRLLVGGDFGAVVVAVPEKGEPFHPTVQAIAGANNIKTFDPVFSVVLQQGRYHLLRHQGGLVALTPKGHGYQTTPGTHRFGLWRAAAVTAQGFVLGGLDGSLVEVPPRKTGSLTLEQPILAMVRAGSDAEKNVVVATGESLLLYGQGQVRTLRLDDSQKHIAATALFREKSGTVLVGTAGGGVYRLSGDQLHRLHSGSGRITALAADGTQVWAGRGRLGLFKIDLNSHDEIALRPQGEICDNHVTKFARHGGRVVVGTFDHGACYLDGDIWRGLPGLPSPMVHGLVSDGYYLWVATSGGITRFDKQFKPSPIGKKEPRALRWLATTAATGAARVGPRQVALSSAHGVVRIWRKRNNKLWLRFTSHDSGVPYAITALAGDAREVFVGSETQGVKAMGFSGLPPRHFQDPVALPENWVTALSAVGRKEIWVATCQSGVSYLRGDFAYTVNSDQGLADNRVVAVAADHRGAFVGTLGGLSWVASADRSVASFGLKDGLPDPRLSGLHLHGKELWVGTESGLVVYRLQQGTAVAVGNASPSEN